MLYLETRTVTFSLQCSECGEMFETAVEMGVFSEVECAACGATFDVTLTVERAAG